MAEKEVEKKNRIVYVEPNDVYNIKKDGKDIQMTPPYEDFCISFNLSAQLSSRMRKSDSATTTTEDDIISLTWVNGDRFRAGFLKGDNFGKKITDDEGKTIDDPNTYLTTYYTDISFENYGTKKIVEGLGVESIQVSFESWYTPTISIKFVDVRGSALWGNEEAIHENGQITASNVFECFFTQPYPQFKLQIKGFLGKPVTYQLTCSSFKGEYNSNTGNFEAVATFIGYSYSLLTDIPMEYIVAAPYSTWYGMQYWNDHINSPEWALDNGNPPIKLFDFFNKIESAKVEINEANEGISPQNNDELKSISTERNLLRGIRDSFNAFVTEMKSKVADYYIETNDVEEKKHQLLLFFSKGDNEVTVTDNILNKKVSAVAQGHFQKLLNNVNSYNSCFTNRPIKLDNMPNKLNGCPSDISTVRMLNIEKQDNVISDIKIIALNNKDKTLANVQDIEFNDERKVLKGTADRLIKGTTKNSFDNNFREFCYIIDLYNLLGIVKEKIDVIDKREREIKRKVNEGLEVRIMDMFTFKPYIGNVFKIIMCHLETLVAIMFEAFKQIQDQSLSGLRSPAALNTSLSSTDIAESYISTSNTDVSLPAWVGVVNQGVIEDSGNNDSANNTLAWVGDFSKNYIEMNVVHGLMAAARKIDNKNNVNNINDERMFFPLTVSDFNNFKNPFRNMGNSDTVSGLSGFLGIRAAQLFGLLCDNSVNSDLIRTIGKMDAYNYYDSIVTASTIEDVLFKTLGSGNYVETLTNIALCNPDYNNYGYSKEGSSITSHKFETVKKVKSEYNKHFRHPVITSNGASDYIYSSYYDKNGATIVPSEIKDFILYKNHIEYAKVNVDEEPYFIAKYIESSIKEDNSTADNWLYLCNSKEIIKTSQEDPEQKVVSDNYMNYDMFNIIDDSTTIEAIETYYDKIKTSGFKLHEITVDDKFDEYIDNFWKVGSEDFSKWYNTTILSLNKKDLGVSDDELMPDTLYGASGIPKTFGDGIVGKFHKNNENIIKFENGHYYNINGNNKKEKNLDELTIGSFNVCSNDKEYGTNIFGHPFYYMQNNIKDEGLRLKVKSLLFLHTLSYDYSNVMNVFRPGKNHGIAETVPYGMLLLMGGLLWRIRQEKDPIVFDVNEYDDIIEDSEDNIYKYYSNGKDYTLLWKFDNRYRFNVMSKDYGELRLNEKTTFNVSVASLFGYNASTDENIWRPDINIENQLVKLFEDFTVNDFSRYLNEFELRNLIATGKAEGRKETLYYHNSVTKDIKDLYQWIYTYKQTGENVLARIRNNIASGWQGVYKMMTVSSPDDNGFIMFFNENNSLVKECKKLYMRKSVIFDANHRRLNQIEDDDTKELLIKKGTYNAYLSAFIDTLKSIVDEVSSSRVDTSSEEIAEQDKSVRDYELQMYYYLKGLWDKWLVQSPTDRFTVKEFFKKNFIFIDSFYRNAYSQLPINCQTLLDIYKGLSVNGSLFTYINEIISKHHCIFFALPDYIGFKDDSEADIETMKDVFRAIPYNKVGKPEDDNKFVIVYTTKPSEIASERSGYKYDSFDIWSRSSKTEVAPSIFKVNKEDIDKDVDDITRMGYNVPSFGVQVNRQNNHIFKKIKVGMDNPVVTEQSILTYENVTNKGRAGERKIVFHGQDIYNIFASYSYSCEVEMIGNAQICPLMYFQLLNIPMWRGTYMIYKVNHTMTPGNMVTRFTGMKMSKMPMNFATTFLSIAGEYNTINESPKGTISGISSSGGVELNSNYPLISEPGDYWSQKESWQTSSVYDKNKDNDNVNPNLRQLFNQLFEEISNLSENKNKPTWNVQITHVLRDGSGTSDHYKGNAMDLTIMRYDKNGKNPYTNKSGTHKPEILKVVDILFSNHSSQIKQVIVEYNNTSDMKTDTIYDFHVLHVSVHPSGTSGSIHQFFIASHDKNYGSINKDVKQNWFLENVPSEFKQVAKRAFYGNRQFFNQQFNNYQFGHYTESQLKEHFGENDISPVSGETPMNVNDRIKAIAKILRRYVSENATVGILANMWRETGGTFDPSIKEKGNSSPRAGIGICQWTGKTQISYLSSANKVLGTNFKNISDMSIEQQAEGLIQHIKDYWTSKSRDNVNCLMPLLTDSSITRERQAYYFVKHYERPYDFSKCEKTQAKNIEYIPKVEAALYS